VFQPIAHRTAPSTNGHAIGNERLVRLKKESTSSSSRACESPRSATSTITSYAASCVAGSNNFAMTASSS
jgi:hypothetical protein